MNHVPTRAALDLMLADIAEAARAPRAARPRAVAEAIGAHVANPTLLAGIPTPCCATNYVRHLLHQDPGGEWAVAALVWRPGQMSPVHAHRAWCAVGVHRGVLAESLYAPMEGGPPEPVSLHLRRPGGLSWSDADPRMIHRLANLGCEAAVSIHAYGLAYDRFCSDLNRVFAS